MDYTGRNKLKLLIFLTFVDAPSLPGWSIHSFQLDLYIHQWHDVNLISVNIYFLASLSLSQWLIKISRLRQTCMYTYVSMHVCIYVSIYPSTYLSTYLCIIVIIISLLHTRQRPLGTHLQLSCVYWYFSNKRDYPAQGTRKGVLEGLIIALDLVLGF